MFSRQVLSGFIDILGAMHSAWHLKALKIYLLRERLYRVLWEMLRGVWWGWGLVRGGNDLKTVLLTESLSPPHVPKLDSQCDNDRGIGIQRWLRQRGGAFMNGISASIKEFPESPLYQFCHVRTQQKSCQALTRLSVWLVPWSWTSGLQNYENKCCLEAILSAVFCYSTVSD